MLRMDRLRILLVLVSVTFAGAASAADIAAGRAIAQAKCAQCHQAKDWEGESAASLESLIRDIVAGKVKHKVKIDLSTEEIANVAAYWGAGKK